jgi:hypothetical protein
MAILLIGIYFGDFFFKLPFPGLEVLSNEKQPHHLPNNIVIVENLTEIVKLFTIVIYYTITIIHRLLLYTSMKHSLLLLETFSACAQLFRHPV